MLFGSGGIFPELGGAATHMLPSWLRVTTPDIYIFYPSWYHQPVDLHRATQLSDAWRSAHSARQQSGEGGAATLTLAGGNEATSTTNSCDDGRCALVIVATHHCQRTSLDRPEWSNLEYFLEFGYVLSGERTQLFSGVDFVFIRIVDAGAAGGDGNDGEVESTAATNAADDHVDVDAMAQMRAVPMSHPPDDDVAASATVVSHRRGFGQLRRLHSAVGNAHLVETPQRHCDIASHGWWFRRMPVAYRARYARVLIMNTGTRGPFWFPEFHAQKVAAGSAGSRSWINSATRWIDFVSNIDVAVPPRGPSKRTTTADEMSSMQRGRLFNDELTLLADNVIVAATMSTQIELHGQSYFLSMSGVAASELLVNLWSTPIRDKGLCIANLEVRACTRMINLGFAYASMRHLVRSDLDNHSVVWDGVPTGSSYRLETADVKQTVFVKHGGVLWPEYRHEDLQIELLGNELRMRRRREATGGSAVIRKRRFDVGRHLFEGFLASCGRLPPHS